VLAVLARTDASRGERSRVAGIDGIGLAGASGAALVDLAVAVVVDCGEATLLPRQHFALARAPGCACCVAGARSALAGADALGPGGTGVAGLDGAGSARALGGLAAVGRLLVAVFPAGEALFEAALAADADRLRIGDIAGETAGAAVGGVDVSEHALARAAGRAVLAAMLLRASGRAGVALAYLAEGAFVVVDAAHARVAQGIAGGIAGAVLGIIAPGLASERGGVAPLALIARGRVGLAAGDAQARCEVAVGPRWVAHAVVVALAGECVGSIGRIVVLSGRAVLGTILGSIGGTGLVLAAGARGAGGAALS